MIRGGAKKKPSLRLKAAEGRKFLPVLIRVFRVCFGVESEYEELIVNCLEALANCYAELDAEPWTHTSRLRLARFGRQHLELYKALGDCTGPMLWHLKPKHHIFIHLCELSALSPKQLWNYGDEDEVGRAVKLAKSCNYENLELSLIRKYRLGI